MGQIAKANAKLTYDNKYYELDAHVSAVGSLANTITDNLRERHISKGHIVDGLLISDMYQMIKSYGNYTSTTIYRVDHKKKSVIREYKKWKDGLKVTQEIVTLDYYGQDDMMILFLNLTKYIENKYNVKNYIFKVVGADRKNGRVDVSIPSKKDLKEIKTLLGEDKSSDWHSIVVMHRKLYDSKKGELAVRIGDEGIVEKAVLKDLIFFGDVRIIRQ